MALKIIDKIKNYKKEQLIYAGNDTTRFKVERIPTSVFSLDLLCFGGIPEGRFTEFFGAKSSGKTTTALRTAGEFLKKYNDKFVLYADFENTYEPKWASNFISDFNRFQVLSPDYAEQGIDVIDDLSNSEDLGLIIIDSVAMITSMNEIEGKADDYTMGMNARLYNKLLRKLLPKMVVRRRVNSNLTVIAINQLRANFKSTGFKSQESKPAGYMQDFVYSLDIRFYVREFVKKGAVPIKSHNDFTIIKNKLGLPRQSGTYTMWLNNGKLDEMSIIISYAKKLNVIERNGMQWKIGGKTYKTLQDIENDLCSDEKGFEKLKKLVLYKGIEQYDKLHDNNEEVKEEEV